MPRFLEDFGENESFVTGLRVIAEADVVAFADLTGDRAGIHLNEEVARESRYGRRIAHGALVFSVSIGLLQSDDERRPHVIAFLGADRLRFPNPVFLGDEVRARQTVRSLDVVNDESGMLETAVEMINQRNEVVAAYNAKFLIKRTPRPTG